MKLRRLAHVLSSRGPMTAIDLARVVGVHVDLLYPDLVAAESRGLVRINVENQGRREERRTWESLKEYA
jgi:hypothetical protein